MYGPLNSSVYETLLSYHFARRVPNPTFPNHDASPTRPIAHASVAGIKATGARRSRPDRHGLLKPSPPLFSLQRNLGTITASMRSLFSREMSRRHQLSSVQSSRRTLLDLFSKTAKRSLSIRVWMHVSRNLPLFQIQSRYFEKMSEM